MLRDKFGRSIRDLRISVTDRCNFRCTYCMPKEEYQNFDFLPKNQILTYEEISVVVRTLIPMGLEKIRITGGEPLLRKDLAKLIKMIRELEDTIEEFEDSCDEDDDNDHNDDDIDNTELKNTLEINTWVVTKYDSSGVSKTNLLNSFDITFSNNSLLTGSDSSEEYEGEWSTSGSSGFLELELEFDTDGNLKLLNRDWRVDSFSADQVDLVNQDPEKPISVTLSSN